MKILAINLGNYGSTGAIMLGIGKSAILQNMKYKNAYSAYPKNNIQVSKDDVLIGNKLSFIANYKFSYYTGRTELMAPFQTMALIRKIDQFVPDVIHLHNIHGWFLNLPLLFRYIKKRNIKLVWTLHDCWAFTGHCSHFSRIGCEKWKTGCLDCSQFREYPMSNIDNSKYMYKKKKEWFSGIRNLTIVTPSQWLADLVKQSYLKDYPIRVINNGINLSVFKPTTSDFKQRNNIPQNKYVILGVAFSWDKRKGLDVFIDLSKRLNLHQYQIVLVGTNEDVEKQLPAGIIPIYRTQNQHELAEIYTVADVFVNPTREENFPTVNIEALACGTPVLTFRTGGSAEIIDETCGSVVECDDVDGLRQEITRICESKPFSIEACLRRASNFDMNERFKEYLALFESITDINEKKGNIVYEDKKNDT